MNQTQKTEISSLGFVVEVKLLKLNNKANLIYYFKSEEEAKQFCEDMTRDFDSETWLRRA